MMPTILEVINLCLTPKEKELKKKPVVKEDLEYLDISKILEKYLRTTNGDYHLGDINEVYSKYDTVFPQDPSSTPSSTSSSTPSSTSSSTPSSTPSSTTSSTSSSCGANQLFYIEFSTWTRYTNAPVSLTRKILRKIRDCLEDFSPDYKKVRMTICRMMCNGTAERFLRFRASDRNKMTGMRRTRYESILIKRIGNRFWFMIPGFDKNKYLDYF